MTSPDHPLSPDDPVSAQERRQYRHEARMSATDLSRATAELAAMRARAAAFARGEQQALRRLALLDAGMTRFQAERERLAARLEAEGEARASAEAALRAQIAALLGHRDEARILRQTISWRITRPLRAIRRPRTTMRRLIRYVFGNSLRG
jgi:hypothetical protein